MKARSAVPPRQKPAPSTSPPAPPEAIELRIEKLIFGGEGLARREGTTVFVPFVLPSERITAEAREQKKNFIRARLERVIEPSAERVPALCPHFTLCGGCDYQHIGYAAQLRYKGDILRETLRRLGKIDWTGEIKTHSSDPWRYRNRAQWKVRPNPERIPSGRDDLAIGYFRAHSTSLCAVHDCPVLSPVLLKTMLALRDALAKDLPRELREVEAFTDEVPGKWDSRVLLTLTMAGFPSRLAEHARNLQTIVPELSSLLFHDPSADRMELFGPGFIPYPVGERNYRVGHFSFFQVNRFLLEQLAREVVDGEARSELALDLFAGVGLFSTPLGGKFERVIAVESNPAAVRDLEVNTRENPKIECRTADVDEFLDRFRGRPDLVVVDPPRAGLSRNSVRRIAQMAPGRFTYVSCEPPTLARDLRGLLDAGYEISDLHLFDLFPETFHMETVVRLRRRS
ncbi:MAG TPA: 23S rRNA (uracil(1939)-C(5))-methyltransferase RlmD [Candidatus Cybelea sp.]|nr:23S rRNA (uracil(1939)-C(5))-methyltransferase RlmD [Candidatus Cybelea sp.]